ncbi:hypothetical protein [Lentzea fradiae]|nr:hypothetical protein [Lentzea fradiae]
MSERVTPPCAWASSRAAASRSARTPASCARRVQRRLLALSRRHFAG